MKRNNRGSDGRGTEGTPARASGTAAADKPTSAAALAELATVLQAHSESLRRDISRLQRALSEINGAMALSLDRADRIRLNTDRLRSIVRGVAPGDADRSPPQERRTAGDRRSGQDRRRPPEQVSGVLRWIAGTSLDRRVGADRRTATQDRRVSARDAPTPEASSSSAGVPAYGGNRTATDEVTDDAPAAPDPADRVVSLAAYRRIRQKSRPQS